MRLTLITELIILLGVVVGVIVFFYSFANAYKLKLKIKLIIELILFLGVVVGAIILLWSLFISKEMIPVSGMIYLAFTAVYLIFKEVERKEVERNEDFEDE